MLPTLRPCQLSWVKSIYQEIHYRDSTMLVAATAAGKTPPIGAVTRIWLRRFGKRALLTAPRVELLVQGKAWIERWLPGLQDGRDIGLEQGPKRTNKGNRVMLASLDSLSDERLRQMPTPDLIQLDECHLHIGAQARIARTFPKAKRVGWTATPDRHDQVRLLPHLYESIAGVYGVAEATRDGYLSPMEVRRVKIDGLDLNKVERDTRDYREMPLSRAMSEPDVVATTVRAIAAQAGARNTIIFAVNLAHAEKIRAALSRVLKSRKKDPVRVASGEMPQWLRDETLDGFRNGEFQFLISVALVCFGYDAPATSCIALARPTLSRMLHSQMIGRGLRLHPEKDNCLVLDLVGNTDDLTLVTPEDAYEHSDEPLSAFLADPDETEAPDLNVEEELADEEPEEIIPLAAQDRGYSILPVDNQLSLIGMDAGRRDRWDKPATPRQVTVLERAGIEDADLLGLKQASELIDKLMQRRAQGWCTLKQARYLQRKRLDPNQKFDLASAAISAIKGNGGRLPAGLIAKLKYRGEETLVMGD